MKYYSVFLSLALATFSFISCGGNDNDGEDGGEENETAFSDGMGKLIKEFRHAQLEALKRKTVEGGLNDAEKKLLLSLLAEK